MFGFVARIKLLEDRVEALEKKANAQEARITVLEVNAGLAGGPPAPSVNPNLGGGPPAPAPHK